jgi:hypothetical protein
MMGWFKSKEAEYINPEIKPIEVPNSQPKGPVYSVGKTEDGKVTLSIGYTTLTMTDDGVSKLIMMLEAAMESSRVESIEDEVL